MSSIRTCKQCAQQKGHGTRVFCQTCRPSNHKGDGLELWRGPSMIDGIAIGVVMTHINGESDNEKIGDMSQLWVLPVDTSPLDAVSSGADESVCGACRLRPSKEGGCYVTIYNTAQRVWWAWQKFGSYHPGSIPENFQKGIRFGAWGDPGAVPIEVWQPIVAMLDRKREKHTAYTHRWRWLDASLWASWCMASVDNEAEARDAQARGWRTFRAKLPGGPRLDTEMQCPNERDASIHCDRCGLCKGTATPARSIVLDVHGYASGRAKSTIASEGRQTMLLPTPPKTGLFGVKPATVCSVCEERYAIRGDGLVRRHSDPTGQGVCQGSGRRPAELVRA